MKHHRITGLLIALALLGCQPTAPVQARKGELTSKPRSEPTTAHVVKWAEDCTANIQAALDMGGTVVIPYVGKVWANVDRLFLPSDTNLKIEAGVVLEARRGVSPDLGAAFLNIIDAENVTIQADGATARGWRMELTNADKVPHSEWRHGARVMRSSHVRIYGLTIENFGGDGFYINDVIDLQMTRVTCADNYRNGLTIISGQAILVTDCEFLATRGHHPQAGVDIEPNNATDELFGIVFRRCLAEGNNGAGFLAHFDQLNSTSPRVMVYFLDCTSRDNRTATPIVVALHGLPPKSKVEFRGCTFWGERWIGQDIAEYSDCKWISSTQTVETSDG
ncbi:MAG: right-handed parallel beta-helix repeat-containing protein [Anaerolineales bacterium]|nr:MAG: right-handed parallel beta-helix repeat-containing protein [Anaerolineales bacterium]